MRKIAFDLGLCKQDIEGGLKNLGDKFVLSADEKYLFIKNFLKHQKDYPLNEKKTTYTKIVGCLESKLQLFNYQKKEDFFDTLYIPYQSHNGIGIGIGNSNNNFILENIKDNNPPLPPLKSVDIVVEEKSWRDDFEVYLTDLRNAYKAIVIDTAYITERAKYHPGLNIKLSLEKACKEFWATEAGWVHKKKSKSIELNWRTTFTKTLNQKSNHVWLQKGESNESERKVAYV